MRVLFVPLVLSVTSFAADTFLEKHCFECHDADVKKGGLDLTALSLDLKDPQNFETWVKVHDSIAGVLQMRELENEQRVQQLNRLRRQLKSALEEVFRMVELGGVLAKSAKIEAAYGQGFASSLSQVSGEFDKVVDEIHSSLESLRRSAFFTGH